MTNGPPPGRTTPTPTQLQGYLAGQFHRRDGHGIQNFPIGAGHAYHGGPPDPGLYPDIKRWPDPYAFLRSRPATE